MQKKVYLTSGPRGTGKTTWSQEIALRYQGEIAVVSRDAITQKLYGGDSICPYTQSFEPVQEIMYGQVAEQLGLGKVVILDCWNGYNYEREGIVDRLLGLGAEEVNCLLFQVPFPICLEWFLKKDNSGRYSSELQKRNYNFFYKEIVGVAELVFGPRSKYFQSCLELENRRKCFKKVIDVFPAQQAFDF